jgi:hypothetical protein
MSAKSNQVPPGVVAADWADLTTEALGALVALGALAVVVLVDFELEVVLEVELVVLEPATLPAAVRGAITLAAAGVGVLDQAQLSPSQAQLAPVGALV